MYYTMKQACDKLAMRYETLRFYCDEGLVPNVQRDKNNYRQFDERNINWLMGLQCLKHCGMSIKDMKAYMTLCLEGEKSIPVRKEILNAHRDALLSRMEQIQSSIDYIDQKQSYYDSVLSGDTEYTSNLID